jgi:hypothetical protein
LIFGLGCGGFFAGSASPFPPARPSRLGEENRAVLRPGVTEKEIPVVGAATFRLTSSESLQSFGLPSRYLLWQRFLDDFGRKELTTPTVACKPRSEDLIHHDALRPMDQGSVDA